MAVVQIMAMFWIFMPCSE